MKFLKIFAITAVLMILAVVGMIVIELLWGMIAAAVANMFGFTGLHGVSAYWVILAIMILVPKAWIFDRIGLNKPYVCHATTDIDASLSKVWDELRPRARDDFYQTTMKNIEAVAGEPNRFDLVLDARLAEDDTLPMRMKLVVEEKIENFYLRMSYLNSDELPLFGKDLVTTEIWLERAEGQTRVVYAENLKRLTIVSALAFLFLNPAKDGLKQLKAKCEGQPDPSWMGKTLKAIGPNGEPSAEMQNTSMAVMASVTILTTLVLGGLMWFVLSLPT